MEKKHDVTVDKHFVEAIRQAVIVMENTAVILTSKTETLTSAVLAKLTDDLNEQVRAIKIGLEYNDLA